MINQAWPIFVGYYLGSVGYNRDRDVPRPKRTSGVPEHVALPSTGHFFVRTDVSG